MKYSTARSINELDRGAWDSLAQGRRDLRYRWLRFMEECAIRYAALYALASDESGPRALFVAPDMDGPLPIPFGRQLGFLGRRVLVLGAPHSIHCGMVVRPDLALSDALSQIDPILRDLAVGDKRSIVACVGVSDEDVAAWRSQGFYSIPFDPITEMAVPSSYDAFTKMMKPRDRRELARVQRRAIERGVTLEQHSRFSGAGHEDVYALLRGFAAHHRRGFRFRPNMFSVLDREVGDDLMIFEARVGRELAGVMVTVREGDKISGPFCGFQVALSKQNYVYPLLMERMIRWAIEAGVRRFDAGPTNYTEKIRFGFEVVPRWLCVRANSNWMNRLAQRLLPYAERRLAKPSR